MQKIVLFIFLLSIFANIQSAIASETTHEFFTAVCPETNSVSKNGGNIISVIDPSSGSLNSSFSPGFTMTTNSAGAKTLTMSASSNIQGGSINAIFRDSSNTKYIILTNSSSPPDSSSISNIKGLNPTPASNPNAIAYKINDPASIPGQLAVRYDTFNNDWILTLTHRGQTNTSITIPSGSPMSNTYSYDDEVGTYQSTITLTFN